MRESEVQEKAGAIGGSQGGVRTIYDEREFFESFYSASVVGIPDDRSTIGATSEMESRFHYNATENAIIRGLAAIEPPPPAATLAAWTMLRRRRGLRLLDIGSGTGHWIDFMMSAFHVAESTGVELTERMAQYLVEKYAERPQVRILQGNIADDGALDGVPDGTFHYITAIGVMFHIVDDAKWLVSLRNLSRLLNAEGVMIIGGDFGAVTRDVQFHRTDRFSSWREHDRTNAEPVRVNKRVRSLADWHRAANAHGLLISNVVRTERDANISTPENDILLLRKA